MLKEIGEGAAAEAAVSDLAEDADGLAQSLGTLEYVCAGPLYHRIPGTAKSDGAFYTNNLSAVLPVNTPTTPPSSGFLEDPKGVVVRSLT